MTALSAAELSGMRSIISTLLPDTCNILTLTNTPDGQGGQTQTWGTSGTAIAFRLDVVTGREMLSGGALQPFTKYKGSLPYDTTITALDRIEHSSGTYAVTGVNTGQSWIAVRRVDLEKV